MTTEELIYESGREVQKMEIQEKRQSIAKDMNTLMEDMKKVGVSEKDTQYRTKWEKAIRCGDP